jgi:selenocysteine lyase/cysteine desulfurase
LVEQTRRRAARQLNAFSEEIALLPSTTAGIGVIAEGLAWSPGDNVVTLANEFPSNLYPWLNLASRSVETRQVLVENGRVDLDRIAAACDSRTQLIAVSWVGYASGWRIDVKQMADLAHERGALLMLDAIQGLGVFPLDVRETCVDFVAADGHKWMLGPEGAGILYVRHEHLDRLRPLGVGWHSAPPPYDFDQHELTLRPDAARYEGGTLNTVGFIALGASLELLEQHGYESSNSRIAQQVCFLANWAAEQLQRAGARLKFERASGHDSGIITFDWPGHDPHAVRKRCLDAGVVVSCRGGGVRISLHGYNDQEDVQRLLACLPPPG